MKDPARKLENPKLPKVRKKVNKLLMKMKKLKNQFMNLNQKKRRRKKLK